jgi:hypothetical protein
MPRVLVETSFTRRAKPPSRNLNARLVSTVCFRHADGSEQNVFSDFDTLISFKFVFGPP